MQLEQLKTPSGEVMQGPLLITPQAFGDDRGWFYESWNQRKFDEAVGESVLFSQDNHSRSIQGVLRGLHYQLVPGTPNAKTNHTNKSAVTTTIIRRSLSQQNHAMMRIASIAIALNCSTTQSCSSKTSPSTEPEASGSVDGLMPSKAPDVVHACSVARAVGRSGMY